MNLAKMNGLLEKFWWAIAIITLIVVTFFSFSQGFDKWLAYFLVPILAAIMALMRRFMKNKLAKSELHKAKKK
jgi:lysylphosphatidylglycerol synthetase-like protein (DUF2156 family)